MDFLVCQRLDSSEWSLHPEVFLEIFKICGRPGADWLPGSSNYHSSKYSLWKILSFLLSSVDQQLALQTIQRSDLSSRDSLSDTAFFSLLLTVGSQPGSVSSEKMSNKTVSDIPLSITTSKVAFLIANTSMR